MIDLKLPTLNPPIWAEQGPLPDRLNVVCVKWGNKYPPDYVQRLRDSVARHMPEGVDWEMFCITDDKNTGVNRRDPVNNWGTWWQKMNMFSPDVLPPGKTLYLDLDVVITGSLEPLIRSVAEQPLIIVENFSPNKAHCAHNSSVMLFDMSDPRVWAIFDAFEPEADRVISKLHGDQCAIWRILRDDIANFERQYVVSYKYHCRGKRLPPKARVVIFHGKPDPHEVNDQWVKDFWT